MLQEPQYNCFEILLAEKLIELGIAYKNYFWRAGLQYQKSNSKNIVSVQNRYYDYYLAEYFGISFLESVNPDIEVVLDNCGSYILKLDYFYLDYCHMYQKYHHIHAIIVNVAEKSIIIQDNYFGYKEVIEREVLISWWNSSKNYINCKLIQLEISEKNNTKGISTLEAITDNYRMMTDKTVYKVMTGYHSYCGISALDYIIKDLKIAIKKSDFESIDFLLEEIDKIRRSRKQAADFFEVRSEVILKEVYNDSYNKWSRIFLLLMKAVVAKSISLEGKNNVVKLFNEIATIERNIVSQLGEKGKNEVKKCTKK